MIALPRRPGQRGLRVHVADRPSFLGTPFPKAELNIAPSLALGRSRA